MRSKTTHRRSRIRPGFTLVELLVVMTIIGLLSTIATVSYSSARIKARDTRRLADMDVVRTALELYSIDNGGFPVDSAEGSDGLVLGKTGAKVLSAEGWTNTLPPPGVNLYLENVPANPGGGGVDYVYYSLNQDGSPCESSPCHSFRIEYALEANVPSTNNAAGAYVLNPSETTPAPPELATKIMARSTSSGVDSATERLLPAVDKALSAVNSARQATVENPTVQKAAEDVLAPAATAAVGISAVTGLASVGASAAVSAAATMSSGAGAVQTVTTTAAAASSAASAFGQIGSLFYLIFTQPLLLLRKRKEYAWGVVYDSQKKMPLDLAIVRLIDVATGRVMQTRVTDPAGRIFFFAQKGVYRIEVKKPGFAFPSTALIGEHEDGHFANLYFGQKFSVSDKGQVINPSIPLDPLGADANDSEFVRRFVRGKLRYTFSVIGIFLNFIAFAVRPTLLIGGLVVLNLLLYWLFRRLAYPKQPAEWGTVKDEKTDRPVAHAVIRLFSAPYNKLIETKVSDSRGRYNFLVGQNVYYLTAKGKGYWKTESSPLDLRGTEKPQIISAPVRLRSLSEEAENRRMDELAGRG